MDDALIPSLPAAAAVPPRADFADWLSPMLVKELRQGVRTRVFVSIFILLQVFMLLDLVLSLLVAANLHDTSDGTIFFWLMVGVPTVLILPISGLNAIGSEIRGNTLELIFLTRLTAFRIVFGKWFALFAQVLLLVCAVLPYLMLRYFIGGVNLANELLILGAGLTASALLTAAATGLSAFPTRLTRPLAVIAGIIAFYFATVVFFSFTRFGGGGLGTLPGFSEILVTIAWSVILLVLLLEIGVARIAPLAENHSGILRSLACASLVVAWITQAALPHLQGFSVLAFVVTMVVGGIAVCEQTRAIPSVYRPFTRWGWPGRLVGLFFYPGWHTGVVFILVGFVALGALLAQQRLLGFTSGSLLDDRSVWFVASLGALLLPVAVARTVFRRIDRPVAIFFAIQCGCLILAICFLVLDEVLRTSCRDLISFLPVCVLLAGPSEGLSESRARLIAVGATTAVSLVAALIASIPAFQQTRRMERESLTLPAPPTRRPTGSTPPAASHAPLA